MIDVNCSKCGRVVGKTGFKDIYHDPSGTTEIGYPLCRKCLLKEAIRDIRVYIKTHLRGTGKPFTHATWIDDRLAEIEVLIKGDNSDKR